MGRDAKKRQDIIKNPVIVIEIYVNIFFLFSYNVVM